MLWAGCRALGLHQAKQQCAMLCSRETAGCALDKEVGLGHQQGMPGGSMVPVQLVYRPTLAPASMMWPFQDTQNHPR